MLKGKEEVENTSVLSSLYSYRYSIHFTIAPGRVPSSNSGPVISGFREPDNSAKL